MTSVHIYDACPLLQQILTENQSLSLNQICGISHFFQNYYSQNENMIVNNPNFYIVQKYSSVFDGSFNYAGITKKNPEFFDVETPYYIISQNEVVEFNFM